MKVYIIENNYSTNIGGGYHNDSYILGVALTIKGANDYIDRAQLSNDSRSGYRVISNEKEWYAYENSDGLKEAKLDWYYTIEYDDKTRAVNHVSWKEVDTVD